MKKQRCAVISGKDFLMVLRMLFLPVGGDPLDLHAQLNEVV